MRYIARCGAALAMLLGATSACGAQEPPIHWEAAVVPVGVHAGDRARLVVAARIAHGWKLYSLTQPPGGPRATTLTFPDRASVRIAGRATAPPPESYEDRNFDLFTEVYHDSVRFALPVAIAPAAPRGTTSVPLFIAYQSCTDRYCLPPRIDTVAVDFTVLPSNTVSNTVATAIAAAPTDSAVPNAAPPIAPELAAHVAAPLAATIAPTDGMSLVRFLGLAVGLGLLSLLTPCILPLVPVTVAFFGQDAARRRATALAHAGGIVTAFAALGTVVGALYGAGGVVALAASPWINLAIAALFAAIALNLFGIWELTLPSGLLTYATRWGTGHGRLAASFLLGLAFALTSFTCTVPFVGTLLVLAAQGDWAWPLAGLLTYAAAFAAPFVALALAPRALARLPRPGAWMMTLKAALGVIELALAAKFVSNADLVLGWGVLTRDVVIALWLGAAILVALVCLPPHRLMRLAGGTREIGTRAVAAGLALVAAAWLAGGLRGRRLGELEAYLPPIRGGAAATLGAASDELPWMLNDLGRALGEARTTRRLVLVDFTGYTCTNCRWMEANMFPRTEVRSLLDRFVRVRLFTDGRGEPYASQQLLQQRRFGTVALPFYAVLDARGTPVATFLGMTRDAAEFTAFLTRSLDGTPVTASR